jgi:hypothetical protein
MEIPTWVVWLIDSGLIISVIGILISVYRLGSTIGSYKTETKMEIDGVKKDQRRQQECFDKRDPLPECTKMFSELTQRTSSIEAKLDMLIYEFRAGRK